MRRVFIAFACLILATLAAVAAQRPTGYADAEQKFKNLPYDRRIELQIKLTAAGFWLNVPNNDFNVRIFDAIRQFQLSNGMPESGFLTDDQLKVLDQTTLPIFANWGFKEIPHPTLGKRLWVPMGLGLKVERDRDGLKFTNASSSLMLHFSYYEKLPLEQSYAISIESMMKHGWRQTYSAIKENFYAATYFKEDLGAYIRTHREKSGSFGFLLVYDTRDASLHNDALQTLISASLWSATTPSAPRMRIPDLPPAAAERPLPADRPATPSSATTSSATSGGPKATHQGSSGTGFHVSRDGYVLTNAHVVEECASITIDGPDGDMPARITARDKTNDLALLKSSQSYENIAKFKPGVRLGESVVAYGYPLAGILSSSGNFTMGNVTALTGLRDDSRFLQVSTPVQPGNSGGPLLDGNGNLVGVISSKLNALRVMVATDGDIPQNVNFAIKASVASAFLESNGILLESGVAGNNSIQPQDLADIAKKISTFVRCR